MTAILESPPKTANAQIISWIDTECMDDNGKCIRPRIVNKTAILVTNDAGEQAVIVEIGTSEAFFFPLLGWKPNGEMDSGQMPNFFGVPLPNRDYMVMRELSLPQEMIADWVETAKLLPKLRSVRRQAHKVLECLIAENDKNNKK